MLRFVPSHRRLFEKAVREAAAGVISLEEACKFREVGSTVALE
jgi:hypothetical protein